MRLPQPNAVCDRKLGLFEGTVTRSSVRTVGLGRRLRRPTEAGRSAT